MGLFDRIKRQKRGGPPLRSGVRELIFCPEDTQEMILNRMKDAFGMARRGEGNRFTRRNGDMEITFTAMDQKQEGEPGQYVQNQIQGVWGYFRAVETDRVEIQRNLLYHLRQCKGMVQVDAVYEGPPDPDKEEAILSQMLFAAEALQGVLTRGMDALVNSRGQVILDRKGGSELTEYMPAELPPPPGWGASAPRECMERRNRTLALLKDRGIYVTPWLPLLEEREEEGPARTVREICGRAAALLAVSLYSECRLGEKMAYEASREYVGPVLEAYEAEPFLSPEERAYLADPDSTEQTQIQYIWQYENLWVMEWALGLTEELIWPDRVCDVPRTARIMAEHPTLEALEAAARPRPYGELLDQADLIYRLHWACVDARIIGMPAPRGLEEGVVMERHRALFWLAGCDERCGWDEVDLST